MMEHIADGRTASMLNLPVLKPRLGRLTLLFLLITPINCYFLFQMELVRYTFPTWVVPLSNVIFILVLVLIINTIVLWAAWH